MLVIADLGLLAETWFSFNFKQFVTLIAIYWIRDNAKPTKLNTN